MKRIPTNKKNPKKKILLRRRTEPTVQEKEIKEDPININTIELPGSVPLIAKKERFCQEYIVDMNIRQAGERAGYKTGQHLYEMMKEVDIQNRISYLQYMRSKRLEISQDRVVQELAAIAFFNIKDLYFEDGTMKPIASLTREEAAAITGVDVLERRTGAGEGCSVQDTLKKIRHDGKQIALMNLGKHLGMFQDKALIDPTVFEMKERKAKLETLSEAELLELSRLMRKASGSRFPIHACDDDRCVGSGTDSGGAEPKTIH